EPSSDGRHTNNGAASRSKPYKKPSSLSNNSNSVTNAFTEAKESISSAFKEMRSETSKPAGPQHEGSSHHDGSKTSFDDVKQQFKEMWASRPVRLPSAQGEIGS